MNKQYLTCCLVLSLLTPTPILSLGSECGGKPLNRSPQTQHWLAGLKHDGRAPYKGDANYKVFRNVRDYGAKGDGQHDDTDAINKAMSEANRCGPGCRGTPTTSPAVVYFPPGEYLVSRTIDQYYYTMFLGDPTNRPKIVFSSNFNGNTGIDADPNNQWEPTCNFFRAIHNMILDTTRVSPSHNMLALFWQTSQATSLVNVKFQMPDSAGNNHVGLRMDKGSGGYMGELEFFGGRQALDVGNQQFTVRNVTISNCGTGIHLSWNWGWTFKGVRINKCATGIDMGGAASVTLLDAHVSNTGTVVKSNGKTLVMDNIQMDSVGNAVDGSQHLAGGSRHISQYIHGHVYHQGGQQSQASQEQNGPTKPAVLLDSAGNFFEKAKPTYADVALEDVVDIKSEGAVGDGKADDTKAIQSALDKYAGCKVIYIPYGNYKVTDTILVPAGTRIMGEVWSVISASGPNFQDMHNPKPMFKVGNAGDVGVFEMGDIIFSTIGPVPGAILLQINLKEPDNEKGAVGLWNTHFRIGGTAGTELESQCNGLKGGDKKCIGAHTSLHIAATGSAYVDNTWAWLADHGLDGGGQLSLYNGRGILVESKEGPVWLYGTASEHNVLYQYNVANARNVVMGLIQTETAYYQPSPPAPQPFFTDAKFNDPEYSNCQSGSKSCAKGYGLRIANSEDVFVYGAGNYDFFQSLQGGCPNTRTCQDTMDDVDKSSKVYIYQLNTVGANHMVRVDGQNRVGHADNANGFSDTMAALVP